MPIVIFWLEQDAPKFHRFGDHELSAVLTLSQDLRKRVEPRCSHVSISSELADSVGKPGVDSIVDGKTPDGFVYDFDKRHRGAGPARKPVVPNPPESAS